MADSDVETKAREMGWKPLEEFKGNPDHWREAEEFVQRGEEILPIVREENKKLRAEVAQTKAQVAETKRLLEASQGAIEELKTFHTEETARAVERAKVELKAAIKVAREAGDEGLVDDLRDQLAEVNAAQKAAPAKEKVPPAVGTQPTTDPDFIAWRADNAHWYEVDENKTALTFAAANRLRRDPANNGLKGKAFYEKAAAEAEAILNPPARRTSKLEEGDGGGRGGEGGGERKKAYSDLPADAKAICEERVAKMVGSGKAFKEAKEWRQYYADIYFAQQGEPA